MHFCDHEILITIILTNYVFFLFTFYFQGNPKKLLSFCEICGIFYDDINSHLRNAIHINEVKKLDYSEIDAIIKDGLDLEMFLEKNGVKMETGAKVEANENKDHKNITNTSGDADVVFVGAWIELE